MKFGISNNVKSRVVRECTPELFHQAMRSELVAEICAEIADGLERLRRGELTKEEYDTLKAGLKKRLPIFTPHATFRNGRRLNADAIPSGLSMYDVDHLPNPRGYWEQKRQE
ncbi:VirE protein, partial [Bacteroides sp. AN502]|nr:VirE protein [Caecibacteroides pullorum]